ncbi:MAG TPA: hypothetical protein VGK59_12555 [Ohtaekwangia sp.]
MKSKKSKPQPQPSKKVGPMPLIVLCIVGVVMCYFAYGGFRSGFRSLDDLTKHTGSITAKGEFTVEYGESGDKTFQNHFYINLTGLDYRLTSYNLDERYGDLDRALNFEDVVTAYYGDGHELYQIEKDGNVVLDISDAHWRGRILGFLMAGGAIFVVAYGIRGHRRNWDNIK